MELNDRFHVVRFAPNPETTEFVNVALLFVDDSVRLVKDVQFERLQCIAPRFNTRILQFWLDELEQNLRSVRAEEVPYFLESLTSQIQVGEAHNLTSALDSAFESKLVDVYLKRQHKAHVRSPAKLKEEE